MVWQQILFFGIVGSTILASLVFISWATWNFLELAEDRTWQKRFWRWLKGHRESYYLSQDNGLVLSPRLLRHPEHRNRIRHPEPKAFGQIVEISLGLFRKRSAIYGSAYNRWSIARSWYSHNQKPFGDWVSLVDAQGLPIDTAVRLVDSYRSLQELWLDLERAKSDRAILDGRNEEFRTRLAKQVDEDLQHREKIERLEVELLESNLRRQQWKAASLALIQILEEGRKQDYRSKTSGRLRNCVESVVRSTYFMREPEPTSEMVHHWREIFNQ